MATGSGQLDRGNWIGLLLHSFDPGFDDRAWERLSNPDVHRISRVDGVFAVTRPWREARD